MRSKETRWPASAILLALFGILLIGVGCYFLFLRYLVSNLFNAALPTHGINFDRIFEEFFLQLINPIRYCR